VLRRSLVRSGLAALVAAVLGLPATPRAEGVKPYLRDPALEGLWHNAQAGSWLRIWSDAVIYGCRISPLGEAVVSDGFVIGWIVLWQQPPGTRAATVVNGELELYNGAERVYFQRVAKMEAICAEHSPRLEFGPSLQ